MDLRYCEQDEHFRKELRNWLSCEVPDYCEMLVRSDPDAPKHKGISWLIVPMDTPGIEIRPLKTLAGTSEFSEVFLEDVRVPVASRVGHENEGWRVANIIATARRVDAADGTAWDDLGLRREIGHLQAELDALWAMLKLSISQAHESGVPGLGLGLADAVLVFEAVGQRRVPGPLAFSQLAAGLVDGAMTGESVVGGLDLKSDWRTPHLIEYKQQLDALLLLREDGVYRIAPDEVRGAPVALSLDPLTPVFHAEMIAEITAQAPHEIHYGG